MYASINSLGLSLSGNVACVATSELSQYIVCALQNSIIAAFNIHTSEKKILLEISVLDLQNRNLNLNLRSTKGKEDLFLKIFEISS